MQLAYILATFAAEGDGGGGLGINILGFLSQLITFIIVFVILWRLVLPHFLNTLDKRRELIREGVENAEKANRDLAEANARAEQIVTAARREAQAVTDRSIKNAEQIGRQIEDEARAHAEQIQQQQQARIKQEVNRARLDLSREVVNLSIEAASKVISRSVDSQDNRRLVEEFVTTSDQARNN